MSSKNALPSVKGNPASAQPMRNQSERAQKFLAPKRFGFNTPIGQQADSDKRHAMRKAAI